MKIFFITHDMHPHTGIGSVSRNLIEGISKRHPDWDITVAVEEASGHPLESATLKMSKWELLKTLLHIRKISKEFDIVHALDGFPYGFAAIMSTLGLRKKVFITAIGSGAIVMLSKPLFAFIIRFCYKRADRFFAISSYTASKVQEYVPRLPVIVINLGADFTRFRKQKGDEKLAKDLGNKKPYMLTVGSFKERKGQKQLVDAYIQAVKKVPQLNYVLVGNVDNAYVARIQSSIDKAGLSDKVFFFEKISENLLRVLYRNAMLFAMLPQEKDGNTDIEGFGLVFLEAASVGLPVIASIEGPSEESVAVGENSILVDPHDIDAISDAIVSISTDSKLREEMGHSSLDFARNMSWDKMIDKYMPYYKK